MGRLLDKAVWWRSQIKVQDNTLVPVGPFEAYNIFDFYFPRITASRETSSLHIQFANLPENDSQAAIGFCERFGVLGNMALSGWGEAAEATLETIGVLQQPKGAYAKMADRPFREYIRGEAAGIQANPTLCVPLSLEEFYRIHSEMREMLKWIRTFQDKRNRQAVSGDDIEWRIAGRLAQKLSLVRFRLEWDHLRKGWVTRFDIGSLEAGFYLMLYLELLGQGFLAICSRCQNFFIAERDWTKFCSESCQTAAKSQRSRNKKKAAKHSVGATRASRTHSKRKK
ncbi:MAG: hypothetical protein KF747_13155 [Nitrospira sp.]|nr:hypothetical protein [Nitrospira sp.]